MRQKVSAKIGFTSVFWVQKNQKKLIKNFDTKKINKIGPKNAILATESQKMSFFEEVMTIFQKMGLKEKNDLGCTICIFAPDSGLLATAHK